VRRSSSLGLGSLSGELKYHSVLSSPLKRAVDRLDRGQWLWWGRPDSNRRSTGFSCRSNATSSTFPCHQTLNCTGARRHASLGPRQRSTLHLARLRPPPSLTHESFEALF